jgi:hypothetical protein
LPTRTSDVQPGDDETAGRPVIVALDSDDGLEAFSPETASVALPAWPVAKHTAAEPAPESDETVTAEAVWPDENFVVRFPDGEPVADADLLPPPPVHEHQPPPPPASPAPPGRPDRTRHLMVGLGVLVLLQAIPTVLWLQARVSPSVGPTAAAAAALPTGMPAELQVATTGRPVRGDVILPAPPPPAAPAKAAARPEARPAPQPAAKGPSAPAVIAAGLLSVDTPVPMQVVGREGVVGTTEAATIMLPPGTHDLEFRNDAVGYRERQTVTLQPGRTTRVRLAPPAGRLHVNALPWAEVWIDNARAGETPIGNLELPVGTHEIVFRHPELGERRATVLVTLKEPARVSVDLRRP